MKVIVVGGGAAGMMAAIAAAKKGHQVELLEQNEKLGKKIYITGKGRCNVTNACEIEDLFENIISNKRFLYSSIYQFDNKTVMQFFEEAGCKLKVERGNRVFPITDHASDITRALSDSLKKYHVKVCLQCAVKELLLNDGERVAGVVTKTGEKRYADNVILATGGLSYPATGSDGTGLKMAARLGHKITRTKPALVPFTLKEDYGIRLQGLALKNVSIMVKKEKKKIYEGCGEMLFTHFGISGPLVISASSFYAKQAFGEEVECVIDLKPALSLQQLDQRVLREFEQNRNKCFKNALDQLFPAKLIPVMIEISGISPEKKVNEITAKERKQLVETIKNWKMTITGTRDFKEAIITQGGIDVKQVNPSTMESKIVPGLYFAGEMLDIDALTGGFNLQLAWSTGFLAGDSIEES